MTAIIDIDSVCYAIGNPNKVLDENGQPKKVLSEKGNMVFQYVEKNEQQLKESCDAVMTDILNSCGCTEYIGYAKGVNTTKSRLAVNPEYKQNRNKQEPAWWSTVITYLYQNWGIVLVHDMEVDDAVNITRLQLSDSFIVAIDSDLLGLEGTHFNWRTKEWITVTKEQAERKFWKDMIVGQPGDNIKGLPRRGEAFWNDQYQNTQPGYFRNQVFEDYVRYLGEYDGINHFFKMYTSLFILEKFPNFVVPTSVVYKQKTWKSQELF